MLDVTWGDTHGTRFIVGIKNGVVKHQIVENTTDAAPTVENLCDEGWDVYYAPALFEGTARKADKALMVPGLWMDLDVGEKKQYDTPQAAMASLVGWLKQHALPSPTHVVNSGFGLHVYWLLDAPVPVEQWRDAANRFKRAAVVAKICDDPGVISDAARILRVPGTKNFKTGTGVDVTLVHESDTRVRLEDFTAALPALGPQRAVPRDDEWAVNTPLPPGDADAIADKCGQMRHFRESGGKLPEPQWRAGLSVLWRCHGGEDLIHQWSKGDERYDPLQTRRKAENTAGPATCQHFHELDPDRCKGCPMKGKVTSPIQIQVTIHPDIEPEPDESWRRSRTRSFAIASGGVWLNSSGDDDPSKQVCLVPLWVVEVRERAKKYSGESDDSTLLVEWVGVDGKRKRAVVRQADVYSNEGLKKWAAAENLASAVLDWKLFMKFISELTLDALKSHGAAQYHDTLGWYKEGFVVGDRMVTADSIEPALVQSSNPISRVKAAEGGTVEGWVKGISILNREAYLLHQFVIQAGFASPLFELANLNSAVIALVGPPGTGKTLSADAALSIYGNPQWLRQGAKSSLNATEKQLGSNRHVPHLVDEITQWSPAQAGGICYMAANGQGDAKLTRTRENAPISTWRLTPFVTSNRPLTDFSQAQFTAAHRARLVELFMGTAMSRHDGAILAETVQQKHYGTAAVPFLQWLCGNRKQVAGLVDRAIKKVGDTYEIADSNRFAVWSLGAAYAAGAAAKALGLISWDPWIPVAEAGRHVTQQAGAVLDANDLARDLVSEWLTEHNEKIAFWDLGGKAVSVVRDPVARVLGNGTIALHRAKVRDLLAEHGVSPRAATQFFGGVEERRLTLTSGASPVWTMVFETEALEFEV